MSTSKIIEILDDSIKSKDIEEYIKDNSCGSFILDNKKYFYSNNNNFSIEDQYIILSLFDNAVDDKKLKTEMAVFAGQLYQYLLSNHQPNYYLKYCVKQQAYFRICPEVFCFIDFYNAKPEIDTENDTFKILNESYPIDNLNLPIKGLSSLITAGLFIGEDDWDESNFGFVKENDQYIAVRIDPGYGFKNFTCFQAHNINMKLNDLFDEYLSKCDEGNYLSDFRIEKEDWSYGEIKDKRLKAIFNNTLEINETLQKIAQTDFSKFEAIFKASVTDETLKHSSKFLSAFKKRHELFKVIFKTRLLSTPQDISPKRAREESSDKFYNRPLKRAR